MNILFSVLTFFMWTTATNAANILALFPIPFNSHINAIMPVLKELAARGHNLTMVSPCPQKQVLSNWTDIVIHREPLDKILDECVHDFSEKSVYGVIPRAWRCFAETLEAAYQDNALQKLIKDDNLNFDLVITEPLFAHESLVAFGHKLNTPVVGYFPLSLSTLARYISGNPVFPSYIPHFRTSSSDHMTFFESLENTFIGLLELLSGIFFYLPLQEKLMDKYMVYTGSAKRPPLLDMLKNISLHLIDYHVSIGYVEPLHPNIVPIGGLSLKASGNLPNDLQKYMDNAVNGVVYLSFGTHKPVSSLDSEVLDVILQTFQKLNVNVLMKWENGTLLNKPDNVELRKWFPQPSVLAHPKCRLFITHGGLHSVSEAIFYGIPIIGIPFFSDQEFNMKFAESGGFGLTLRRNDVTLEKFKLALETVLFNNSYKEQAMKRSLIVRDRPMSALDTAVYWIEYVIRHKDMSHLRPASVEFPLYHLLFSGLIFLAFLLVFIIVLIILCKVLLKLLLKPKTEIVTKNKRD